MQTTVNASKRTSLSLSLSLSLELLLLSSSLDELRPSASSDDACAAAGRCFLYRASRLTPRGAAAV